MRTDRPFWSWLGQQQDQRRNHDKAGEGRRGGRHRELGHGIAPEQMNDEGANKCRRDADQRAGHHKGQKHPSFGDAPPPHDASKGQIGEGYGRGHQPDPAHPQDHLTAHNRERQQSPEQTRGHYDPGTLGPRRQHQANDQPVRGPHHKRAPAQPGRLNRKQGGAEHQHTGQDGFHRRSSPGKAPVGQLRPTRVQSHSLISRE